jgi:hypothetical protein
MDSNNALANITFKNSVIRYHGGPVMLYNVTFVNCTFILDLPFPVESPARPNIYFTLLDSPDQRTVRISTPS